jgi:ribosomal protein S12 methylthiotransferase accessory factor
VTEVRLAGEGPAAEAVAAALADTDATVEWTNPDGLPGADLGVVVGPVGAAAFEAATGTARDAGTPWLAVELGGVGGHALPSVDAAVAGFGAGTACPDCLRTRVAAGLAGADEAQGGLADGDAAVPPTTARFAGALAGRAAADLVAGRETATLGSVVEVPHAERRLLPVPGCDCEREAPGPELDRSTVERTLDESVDRLERAVDRRLGPVREISEAESFPAPYYLAELAATPFGDGTTGGLAAGVATDWSAALGKALGEGLERYAAAVYRNDTFQTAPPAAVESAVPPSAFVRPDEGWHTPDPNDELAWVAGEALASGERAWLPAEFVAFPPPEPRHRPAITTGLGFGSGVDALLSGLYEVVERDAAMLAWYSTFEPLGLAVGDETVADASDDAPLATFDRLRRRARSEGLEMTALLLTQDIDVPVVACAVHREDESWPRVAAGMAADLDPAAAARDALAEAVQNWLELRGMGRQGATEQQPGVARAAEFPRGVRSFCDPETTVPLGAVGGSAPPEPDEELPALVETLGAAGLDPYAARLTTRDVAALGFEAVRVLVPSAQPLFSGTPYFGERAREVPGTFGCEPRLDRAHHPFP